MDDGTFPALLKTLSDPSEEVVKHDLQLLAQISSSSEEGYFKSFMYNLLEIFSTDRRLLETRGSLIVRQLCLSLNTERIYRCLAEILEKEEVRPSPAFKPPLTPFCLGSRVREYYGSEAQYHPYYLPGIVRVPETAKELGEQGTRGKFRNPRELPLMRNLCRNFRTAKPCSRSFIGPGAIMPLPFCRSVCWHKHMSMLRTSCRYCGFLITGAVPYTNP